MFFGAGSNRDSQQLMIRGELPILGTYNVARILFAILECSLNDTRDRILTVRPRELLVGLH